MIAAIGFLQARSIPVGQLTAWKHWWIFKVFSIVWTFNYCKYLSW